MNIFENVLIELPKELTNVSTIVRVLWVDASGIDVVTIDVCCANALPVWHKCLELENILAEKKAHILETDIYAAYSGCEDMIPENHRRKRDEAWEVIAPIVNNKEKAFLSVERGTLIKQAVERTGRNKVTIYKYLRRYWQGGQKPNALLPKFSNCGGASKERHPQENKRGRPSKQDKLKGKVTGINVDLEIRQIITKSARIFHEKQGRTLKDAYQHMLQEYFSHGCYDSDGVKIPILLGEEQRPSFRQFCYWYYKERDFAKSLKLREGQHRVNLRYREVLGDSTQMASHPGALWQIDSTIGDIYLVSSLDRKRIIGRPILYLIVDLFSRLIVGFNISLEGPSWLGAALALENATTDKVKFCAEHGISITAEQWPCHHLCKSLLTDRGSEYLSANATHMVKSLGIELQNTPAYRPDWKAVVERLFRLINDEVIHWEPGAVYKPRERGERDYRLDAIYTLEEFRKIIIRLIIYYNNYHWLSEYPINRAMISDGVDPIPCELWNWGIHNYGRPRFETTEIIRLNLLPTAEASITRRGINFSGLRYTCELANKEQWFLKAGIKGSWKQAIAYDPRNLDNIYLRLDNDRHLEICHLLPASKAYQRCNWYEVADHFTETNFARHDAKPRQEQAKAALNTYIDDIKTSASEQTVNTFDSQTKNSRVKDIRQNRKAEREYEQELNAWDLRENLCSESEEQLNSTSTVATLETDDEYVPPHRPIDELRKSLIRKLNNESY
ncbi:MAG: transposase [Richelia sp. SM1_7_0]|nr:transposase [Richelia sp. SM1_7_0]